MNSGKIPTVSSKRASLNTSARVRSYWPTILRESRMPIVLRGGDDVHVHVHVCVCVCVCVCEGRGGVNEYDA